MTDREKFINVINYLFFKYDNDIKEKAADDYDSVVSYWNNFKNGKLTEAATAGSVLTEKGEAIIRFMQANSAEQCYTSTEISKQLNITPRSVSTSMNKLVSEKYVQKMNTNPISYRITDSGRNLT